MKHIFPEVPINAGCFAPLHIPVPERNLPLCPISAPCRRLRSGGRAAHHGSRLRCDGAGHPRAHVRKSRRHERQFLALGGWDPERGGDYIMYFFSGGGYGGWWQTDGLTNGCSSVGISKTQPVEILEQHYPILVEEYALREGSGGAGRHRGGFGISYRVRMLRGEGKASFLMDHGRTGPPGLLDGEAGSDERDFRFARRPRHNPRAPVEGRRISSSSRRLDSGSDAGWWRLWPSGGSRSGTSHPRSSARLRQELAGIALQARRGICLIAVRGNAGQRHRVNAVRATTESDARRGSLRKRLQNRRSPPSRAAATD